MKTAEAIRHDGIDISAYGYAFRTRNSGMNRQRKLRKSGMLLGIAAVLLAGFLALMIGLKLSEKTTVAGGSEAVRYYKSITIGQGDSLWTIAEQSMGPGVTDKRAVIDEICRINGLTSETIHAGAHLVIPCYEA